MNPPRLASWLLRRLLPFDSESAAIRGDLLEEFRRRATQTGIRAARAWYAREAFSLVMRGHGYKKMITFDALRQDARFAWRSFVKAPAFTAVVVTTLALGIGASTAIFSIVNGILLRPLPLHEPDRLLWINEANARGNVISTSWMNYVDWRARARSFEGLAASRGSSFVLMGSSQARRILGRTVTANFFGTVGVRPVLGRDFSPADEKPGAERVLVISHEFWQRQLNGDQAVLGRAVMLDGRPSIVVGVLPAGFRYLRNYDVFTAVGAIADAPWLNERGNHQGFVAVGRLRPGVTQDAAITEMGQIEADLGRTYPDTNTGLSIVAEPLGARLVAPVRETLLVLFGAVGLLLLIACVNVAGLLIARGAAREHEFAVRAALGGRRSRLVVQLLVESSLLSALGGALGIALAAGLLRALLAVAPAATPRLDEIGLDARALAFALAAATACGALFGLLPAVQASRPSGQRLVIRTRATGSGSGSHRLRGGLVAIEVALAVILLTGAGLMMRTFARIASVETGFQTDHVLTASVSIPEAAPDEPKRTAITNEILARTRALPGVLAAGAGYSLPVDGSNWNSIFWPQDKPVPPTHDGLPTAAMVPISDGYFDALGARIVQGRDFTRADTASSAPVTIVNRTLANRIWPGQDPIGKRLKQGWPEREGAWREVVGVVGDIKFDGVTASTSMQVYLPMAQDPPSDYTLVIRSAVDPASMATPLAGVVSSVSRDIPVSEARTMEQVVGDSLARQRLAVLVLGVFAVVALALAWIGLYGVISYWVTERRHEIGVRMALGARRADVVRMVVMSGVAMMGAGTLLGIAGASAVTKSLAGLLFGVEPLDPVTFAGALAALALVGTIACYIPAWRATRIAPVTALRSE